MALAVDNANTFAGLTSGNVLSGSHTCNGSDRALIVCVWFDNFGGITLNSVTYNGVGMTLVGGITDVGRDTRIEIWKLSNPASGSNTVSLTFSADTGAIVGAVSFTGAHQTTGSLTGTPASAEGNGGATSINVSSAVGEIVVDIVAGDTSFNPTAGAGQTQQWKDWTTFGDGAAGSTEAGATTVTMSWSGGAGSDWSLIGVSVKEAPSPPQTLTPSAIASAEAFGTQQANFGLLMNAIVSAEAFGAVNLAYDQMLVLVGVSSAEAFGIANMAQDVIVVAVAVPSEEVFGTPLILLYLVPSGVISGEAFGSGFVHFEIPFDLDLVVLLLPDLDMDVTGQVFSIPNVEEVDLTVSLTPDMDLESTPQEWDFTMTVN